MATMATRPPSGPPGLTDRIDDGGVWITGRNGIDRVARAGLAGTSKYWGRIPDDSGEGLLGDVPVWIGRAAVDATGGDS